MSFNVIHFRKHGLFEKKVVKSFLWGQALKQVGMWYIALDVDYQWIFVMTEKWNDTFFI